VGEKEGRKRGIARRRRKDIRFTTNLKGGNLGWDRRSKKKKGRKRQPTLFPNSSRGRGKKRLGKSDFAVKKATELRKKRKNKARPYNSSKKVREKNLGEEKSRNRIKKKGMKGREKGDGSIVARRRDEGGSKKESQLAPKQEEKKANFSRKRVKRTGALNGKG